VERNTIERKRGLQEAQRKKINYERHRTEGEEEEKTERGREER
jgi:hypothetical protein